MLVKMYNDENGVQRIYPICSVTNIASFNFHYHCLQYPVSINSNKVEG